MNFRLMTIDDYDEVLALIHGAPGVAVRAADSPEAIGFYPARNPGFSLVAEIDGRVVGCVLCGHDGRRGSLNHVVVHPAYRRQGIGRDMVERALDGLEAAGIYKTHLDVFAGNREAIAFRESLGQRVRTDIRRFSFNCSNDPNI